MLKFIFRHEALVTQSKQLIGRRLGIICLTNKYFKFLKDFLRVLKKGNDLLFQHIKLYEGGYINRRTVVKRHHNHCSSTATIKVKKAGNDLTKKK